MGLDSICSIFGFINCSRWRKASKCKKLIKSLKHRLIIHTNRINTMMRQLREDIAQLLQNGHNQSAFARVPQLYKEEQILLAYERVNFFCDCAFKNIDEITGSTHRKLSGHVREAISSLIFAASRCGNLPELQSLRYFFKGIFGHKFERANVELLPGNCVDSEMIRSLSIKIVPKNVKTQIINEILREIKLNPRESIQVHEPRISEDGNNGIKDQTETKLFENVGSSPNGSMIRKPPCVKTVCENCHGLNKNKDDLMEAIDYRSAAATPQGSKNEDVVRDECSKDTKGLQRSPHVHPKLPEYHDLVLQFTSMKKRASEQTYSN